MVGSKKALQVYLRMEAKELAELWARNDLVTPVEYVRMMTRERLLEELITFSTREKAGAYFGVSASFLTDELKKRGLIPTLQVPTVDMVKEGLEKFKSVRLAARKLGCTEGKLREIATKGGLDLSKTVDYAFSNHTNAKGRRGEEDYSRQRGESIIRDLNLIDGSKAPYDFDDKDYGRVNVKASRAHKRMAGEEYWKFSLRGKWEADHFAFMFYDVKMQFLRGIRVMKTGELPEAGSLTLYEKDMARL